MSKYKKRQVIKYDRIMKETYEYKYEVGFFGVCLGVVLSKRDEDDLYVVFNLVVEDDGVWHISEGNSCSAFWFPELRMQMDIASEWMKMNCDTEKWGYKFKDIKEQS